MRTAAIVLTSVLAIAGVAGGYLWFNRSPQVAPPPDPRQDGGPLVAGHEYRILVIALEAKATNAKGGTWDNGGDAHTAPDMYYTIRHKDGIVYTAEPFPNSYTASWGNTAVTLDQIWSGKVGFESIRQGAQVTMPEAPAEDEVLGGHVLPVEVFDDDPLKDDPMEEFRLRLAELKVGENRIEGKGSILYLKVRVIPRERQELEDFFK